jgi:hypothetical protein
MVQEAVLGRGGLLFRARFHLLSIVKLANISQVAGEGQIAGFVLPLDRIFR